jgi:hypothetical protein
LKKDVVSTGNMNRNEGEKKRLLIEANMSNQAEPSVVELIETTCQVEKQHHAAESLVNDKVKKEGRVTK